MVGSIVMGMQYRRSATVSWSGPSGPAGQAPPDPYRTGVTRPGDSMCPTGDRVPHIVGARRCLAPLLQAQKPHLMNGSIVMGAAVPAPPRCHDGDELTTLIQATRTLFIGMGSVPEAFTTCAIK